MVVIYCSQDKRKAAQKQLQPKGDYVFASPTDSKVDYTARKVIVVGNHPALVKRYKGIVPVEQVELKKSDTKTQTKPKDSEE